MAIIRIEKKKGYTVMSNYHLRDRELSLKAKGLMSVMLSLPDNWTYTVRGLTAILKETRSTVMTCVQELEAAGYVDRTQTRKCGRFGGMIYNIHEIPDAIRQNQRGSPWSEKPTTVKPTSGKPMSGNCTQINKEKRNTEKNNYLNIKDRFAADEDIPGWMPDYSFEEGESIPVIFTDTKTNYKDFSHTASVINDIR